MRTATDTLTGWAGSVEGGVVAGVGAGALVAECAGSYVASKETIRDRVREGAVGCDDLTELLDAVEARDRLDARIVELTGRLASSGEAEQVTQLPLELWLSFAGRLTSTDRRMLTQTADVLADCPAVADAFGRGWLSWSQVRPMVVRLRDIRVEVRRAVDDGLAELLEPQLGWEPDELVWRIDRLIDAATPDVQEAEAEAAERDSFLHIQPDLFAQHSKIYGEVDTPTAVRFAEHLDHIASQSHSPDACGAADIPPLPAAARDRLGQAPDAAATGRSLSRRRGAALRAWMLDPALGCPGTHEGGRRAPAVDLKLVMTLDALLGRDGTPAELLTTLTGRRVKVAAGTARRLLDEGGAAVRSLIFEETGQALGAGHRTQRPPGWLSDLLQVMQPSGIAPGRSTPARTADIDHHRRREHLGPTDLDNLGVLARSDHRLKESSIWRVEALEDGSRRWTHHPTGMVIDKPPWTRQPKPPKLSDLPPRTTKARRRRRGDPNAIPPPRDPPTLDDG